MTIERRGFLGSLIGMVGGAPFYAKVEPPPLVFGYYLMFRDTKSGLTLQAPGIKEIRPVTGDDESSFGFEFVSEPLEIRKPLTLDASYLYKADGTLIKASRFFTSIHFCNGDALKVTHHIKSEAKLTLEELVDLYLKIPLRKRDIR